MTSYAPSPHGPDDSSTRVRVKWDNVMIVLIGTVVAAFAVVGILMYSGPASKPKPAKDTSSAATTEVDEFTAATDAAPAGELSLDDAIGVVEEVRALMTEGRWDEASDRLELIPAELQDASGATVAQQELDDRRESHEQLRSQLEAAVEARNWKGARTLLTQLAALAPLDADLTATQELVDTSLTPKSKAPAADAQDATATGGGGASAPKPAPKPATSPTTKPAATTKPASGTKPTSGAKPASSTPKPATGGARPAATGGGASTGGSTGGAGATGGSSSDTSNIAAGIGSGSSIGDLGINLTPQQEAELEAALDQAISGL